MASNLRRAIRGHILPAIAVSTLASFSGCPVGPVDSFNTTLTIYNEFPQFKITNIRMVGPDDNGPGDNILTAPINEGTGVEIAITAPDRETMPDGVTWTAIVAGQLQVRAKQNDPNDLRPVLNANFNTLDTNNDGGLSLAEIQVDHPEVSQSGFQAFDINNSGLIELSETGALMRFASATFTCVHYGDKPVWNFNGESPEDYCADAP